MDLYFLSMGQNMLIEPLQALNITNTILNNGIYTKLKLIDKIVNENNEVIKEFSNTSDKSIEKRYCKYIKKYVNKYSRKMVRKEYQN